MDQSQENRSLHEPLWGLMRLRNETPNDSLTIYSLRDDTYVLFKYKWYIQATGEVLLMLSLYSLGSGWPCVWNPLCLCWWGCPWIDRWMEGPVRTPLPCWGGFLGCPVSEPRRDAAPGQISSLLVGMSLDGWLHRNLWWESPLSWPCMVLIRLGSKSTTELFGKTLGRATKWTPWL